MKLKITEGLRFHNLVTHTEDTEVIPMLHSLPHSKASKFGLGKILGHCRVSISGCHYSKVSNFLLRYSSIYLKSRAF